MTIEQYEQLDWSPTTWALLQLGMVLFTVAVIGLFVWMVHRAGQATAPVRAVEPEAAAELEPSPAPSAPSAASPVAVQPAIAEPAADPASVDPDLAHV